MAMTIIQHALNRIAGEASELAQIALKTQEFGVMEKYSEETLNNIGRVRAEFNDLLGAVNNFNDVMEKLNWHDCYILKDLEAVESKEEKINKYRDYSQKIGQTEKEDG